MSKKIVIGSLAALVAVAIGITAWFATRDSGPEQLVLGERATTTTQPSDGEGDEPTTTVASEEPAPDGVEGEWTVNNESLAGYRVVEDFAGGISDFEAVGRTSDVTGSLTIAGTQVTDANFSVDVATIVSDDGRRDNQFAGPIMNSDEFPTADFVLTSPIELGSIPDDGTDVTADATGDLTLRGVTNTVTFPLTARLVGSQIETLGAIDVVFADYNIDNPSFAAISVRDVGLVEFSLIFDR